MPEVTDGLREKLEAAVEQLRETGAVYAIEDAEIRRIADALLPVVAAHTEWAETCWLMWQERAAHAEAAVKRVWAEIDRLPLDNETRQRLRSAIDGTGRVA